MDQRFEGSTSGIESIPIVRKYAPKLPIVLLTSMDIEFAQLVVLGEKYACMALPVYSTDIIYNILKRAARKCKNGEEYTISEQDIIKSLKKAYENIGEELGKEDAYYSNLFAERQRLHLRDAFVKCPIVDIILNGTYGNQFESMFCDFIKLIKLHETTADTEEIFGEI